MYPWVSGALRSLGATTALGETPGAMDARNKTANPPATGSLARQRLIRQAMDDRFSGNQSSPEPDWMTSWSGVKKSVGEGAGRLKEEMKRANEASALAQAAPPAPPQGPSFTNRFGAAYDDPRAPAPAVPMPQMGAQSVDEAGFAPPPQMTAAAAQLPAPAPQVASPHGAVEMPAPPWRQNAAPAPEAPAQMPWWIRNGMMQRDEQGNFLDQQMAQRAMGSFS